MASGNSSQRLKKHSILVLGKTQSGKSALIEHIKKYADPNYSIDKSLLGNGNLSKTESTQSFLLESNLPAYEVFRKDSGDVIDVEDLSNMYSDVEDYRDILQSRENDFGLRLVPQDTTNPSEIMEFQFLDTPGFNNTQDRDITHAVDIMTKIIATVSFNLIIIVVSSRHLQQDQAFALEYYANVLSGLHSRIMFLHTHVDYATLHHADATHRADMNRKNKILHGIFRHPTSQQHLNDGEVYIDYPSLTIDLETTKRPVKQWLVRNTIREILKMATAPPVLFDTSVQNIERIRAIPHPSIFDCDLRQRLKDERSERYSSFLKKPKHSILIMGKTQSGKSTLMQFVKNYVDRHHKIDRSRIGTGNSSITAKPIPFVVKSNLPKYEVVNKKNGVVLELSDNLAHTGTEDDYDDLMKLKEAQYELREAQQDPDSPPSESVEFMFLDTPGYNDTKKFDVVHAENIIKATVEIQHFNLILFVVDRKTNITQELKEALKFYSDIFKELRSSFALLFTHVDYINLYPNSSHHDDIKALHRNYSRLLHGLDDHPEQPNDETTTTDEDTHVVPFTHFLIDFDNKKRPVMQWLIRNTLRNILQLAVTNRPALLDLSMENIKRVRDAHPRAQNNQLRMKFAEQFKKVETGTPTDTQRHSTSTKKTHEDQSDKDMHINILVLGDIQSGKTSLVETMKTYASQKKVADQNSIRRETLNGDDEKVRITSFLSELPTVEIQRLRGIDAQYDLIDLDQEGRTLSEEDFDDLLNWTQKDISTRFVPSTSQKRYHFNIYEGPSLNVSADNFEKNIFIIHKAIVESEQKFHQVLFTLAPGPITDAIKTTIEICSDIFSDLSSLFSFVHTKIDYSRLHIDNRRFQEFVQERQDILRACLPSQDEPILIDCDFHSKWPIRQGKTQIVIRKILLAATTQKAPVAKRSVLMKKTPKMVEIDTCLKWKVKDELEGSRAITAENNSKRLCLLNALRQIDETIDEMAKSRTQQANLHEILPDDLDVVFAQQYTVQDDATDICSLTMQFDGRGRTIECVDLSSSNIEIELDIGGKSFDHWMIVFRRSSSTAYLNIKLYARKPDNKGSRMGEPEDLAALRQQRVGLEQRLVETEDRMMDLWKVQEEYYVLRDWISRETLPTAVMESLTTARVYEVKEVSEAPLDMIKKIYLRAEGVYSMDPVPVRSSEEEECESYFDMDDLSEGEEDKW